MTGCFWTVFSSSVAERIRSTAVSEFPSAWAIQPARIRRSTSMYAAKSGSPDSSAPSLKLAIRASASRAFARSPDRAAPRPRPNQAIASGHR